MSNSLIPVPVSAPSEKHLTKNRTYQGIPGVALSANGRLFSVCYTGGEGECRDNFLVVFISDDRGETWSDVVAVVDPPAEDTRAFDPTLWLAPDGRFFLFWSQVSSFHENMDNRSGAWFSILENPDASPETFRWSAPVRIDDGIMMNKPVALSDGSWAFPISVWQCAVERHPEGPAVAGSKMYRSTDGGKTISFQGMTLVPHAPSFDEHSILELRDGRLWMVMRTTYGNAESFSADGGKTWTTPWPSKIKGPCSRIFLLRLQSGRLLLVNNLEEPQQKAGPTGWKPRRQMIAWLSDDEGKSWYGRLMLDERDDVSYPDGAQAADGTIYVTYDRDRHGMGEILVARFREEDVAGGGCVTSDARLKLVSNRTRGPRWMFKN